MYAKQCFFKAACHNCRTLKIAAENLYLAKTDGRNKIYMNGEEIRY